MPGETEERRKQLLHQVRGVKQYQGWDIPAIHPRYRNSYQSLYAKEERTEKSTFQMRCVIAIICFAGFVWMKQEDVKIISVNSTQIVNQIGKTFLHNSFIGQ